MDQAKDSEAVGMLKTIQAKNISDAQIVEAVRITRGRNGVPQWANDVGYIRVLERLSERCSESQASLMRS
jgi:hypothetical protein